MQAHVHQVTIDAHRRYQELMAESHRAFLDMAGSALSGLGATGELPAGATTPAVRPAPASVPTPVSMKSR